MPEVIIKFKPRVSEEAARSFIQAATGLPAIEKSLSGRYYRADISNYRPNLNGNNRRIQRFIREFESSNDIEYIEDNIAFSDGAKTNSFIREENPLFKTQWGLENTGQEGYAVTRRTDQILETETQIEESERRLVLGKEGADINAIEAWDIATGKNVIIAVIDTGVDYRHPDLRNNIWINPNEILNGEDDDGNGLIDDIRGWDFINEADEAFEGEQELACQEEQQSDDCNLEDNNPLDNDSRNRVRGHGTGVAGVIAATGNNGFGILGVSWKAQIMPLRALGTNSTIFDALQAIEYATRQGANIINGSWGGQFFSQALDDVIRQGPLYIASAGNDNRNIDQGVTHFPAGIDNDNVISVAATNRLDQLQRSSNFGERVDLAAPGDDISTTGLGNVYVSRSKTSFAAPHVAGAAALIVETINRNNPTFKRLPQQRQNSIVRDFLLTQVAENTIEDTPNDLRRLQLNLDMVNEFRIVVSREKKRIGKQDTELQGNSSDEILVGSARNDALVGNGGDDILVGENGNDTLTGGGGQDKFRFFLNQNGVDQIIDFNQRQDSLEIILGQDNAEMFALNNGLLKPNLFSLGTNTPQSGSYFLYEQQTGLLSFNSEDSDTSRPIVRLRGGTQLSSQQIFVR